MISVNRLPFLEPLAIDRITIAARGRLPALSEDCLSFVDLLVIDCLTHSSNRLSVTYFSPKIDYIF